MFLILNAGSSTLKYEIFTIHGPDQFTSVLKGVFDRIGGQHSTFLLTTSEHRIEKQIPIPDHGAAARFLCAYLLRHHHVTTLTDITGVGHRVVNLGQHLRQSVLLTSAIWPKIDQGLPFAPLHNPAFKATLQAMTSLLHAPHVLVFDTGFHVTMPLHNHLYPIPWRYYEQHQVRRYGAHGISYRYIVHTLHHHTPAKPVNAIVCHLGNGASICAVRNGQSVNTTMGFSPLEGLIMGTRSGTIDPSLGGYLSQVANLTQDQFTSLLNHQSGLQAISRISNDIRDLETAVASGNEDAALALKMFTRRVAHFISAYQNEFQQGDDYVLVFTGGIGENAIKVVRAICEQVKTMNLKLDAGALEAPYARLVKITTSDSSHCAYQVHTNEEFVICQDVYRIINA